jgi:NAD(P)H-quinone oxidoreductase subunit 5
MSASTYAPLVLRWLALGIPISFATAIARVTSRAPFRTTKQAATLALGLALAVAMLYAFLPGVARTESGSVPISLLDRLVRIDVVTCAMLLLVTFLALVIVSYSQSYLHGEADQPRYARALLTTLAAVSVLVLSRQLMILALAWLAMSLALHQLLIFYRDRQQAQLVAHKKFLLSRCADACMLGALLLIARAVGSLDLDRVDAWAKTHPTLPVSLQLAAVLLVLAVSLKSAQLPFHGWLIQVMEAPTPVSALLHAGVVNMGGLVLIRLAPLMEHALFARSLLVVLGTTTAVVGALVTTTRVSIKVALAWSTCAQMGFLLVECGFAAWHLALLHLVAHSLYKAHAFLSSGGTVDTWRATTFAPQSRNVNWLGLLGTNPRSSGAVLASVLTLGFFGFAWHWIAGRLLPSTTTSPPFGSAVVIAGMMVLVTTQSFLRFRPRAPRAREIYALLFAGLYLDEIFTRLTFRVWPPRLQRP